MNKVEKYLLSIFSHDLQRNMDKLVEPLNTSLLRYDYFVEVSKEHAYIGHKEYIRVRLVNTRYTDMGANVYISHNGVIIETYLNNNNYHYRLTEKVPLDKEYINTFYDTLLGLEYFQKIKERLAFKTNFEVSVPEINKSLKRYLKRYKRLSNKGSFQLTVLSTDKTKKYTFRINKTDILVNHEKPKILKVVELPKPDTTYPPYYECNRDNTRTHGR